MFDEARSRCDDPTDGVRHNFPTRAIKLTFFEHLATAVKIASLDFTFALHKVDSFMIRYKQKTKKRKNMKRQKQNTKKKIKKNATHKYSGVALKSVDKFALLASLTTFVLFLKRSSLAVLTDTKKKFVFSNLY